jgi:hypothetical protein
MFGMKPLQEWLCDTCGEVIRRPEEGYVEWLQSKEDGVREFNIVHHAPASPHWKGAGKGSDCYQLPNIPSGTIFRYLILLAVPACRFFYHSLMSEQCLIRTPNTCIGLGTCEISPRRSAE